MKRERVPKEVWIGVHNDILYVGEWKSKLRHHRYVLPSRSTVEKRLRDAVVKAAMREWNWKLPGTTDSKHIEELRSIAKSHGCCPIARACARLALHLRATRKDAR